MPTEGLKEIITKAIVDESYRRRLLDDPDEAIKSHELSEAEAKMLRSLQPEAFEELAKTKGEFRGPVSHGLRLDPDQMEAINKQMRKKRIDPLSYEIVQIF